MKPFAVVLVLLAAVAVAAAEAGRRTAWTTVDEPVHLAAARELADGRGVVSNFEHPVLMKVVSAAGLASRPPGLIVEETRDGRRLFPWLLGLLVLGAGLWARRLAGPVAGAGAAVLVLADPTLRGHAPLVQSDLLLAVCLVWAGFLLDAAARGRRVDLRLAAASGAAYGLALVSKYSALPFLPVFLAVAALRFARARRPGPVPAGVRRKRTGLPSRVRAVSAVAATALLGATALATAVFVQEATLHGTPRERLRAGIARSLLPVAGEAPTREALDRAASAPKGVAAYVTGLSYVRAAAAPGARYNYFLGEVSGEGHPLYFVTALLVKAPAGCWPGFSPVSRFPGPGSPGAGPRSAGAGPGPPSAGRSSPGRSPSRTSGPRASRT
ncbi:MAG: glycosyltransferase family 39 protein [Holophagales bacterium]|nr:glycosyltransferase family 39 protein [Holophagales bacterium]